MDALSSTRRRTLLQAAGAAAMLAACGEPRALPAPAGLHVFDGLAMGAMYRVKLVAPGISPARLAAARAAVAGALDGVVAKMSLYDTASELSRFNVHASTAPFAVSPDTVRVFELARGVSEASGGAFDITVAPLVDVWGFGPDKHRYVPPEDVRRAALARVGYRLLAVDVRARTVVKATPDVSADFSGIAQGYGADLAARALEALGFDRWLIDLRSEIRARGLNAEGQPWQVAIEQPEPGPPRARLALPLSDLSLATSGDYRIFFVQDGRRYSHEIDSASGAPTRHALACATVAMPECALADAWATALYVLGPDRGPALAESLGLAAHFVVRNQSGYRDISTRAFAALGARMLFRT